MKKSLLREYARLIAVAGGHVQKKQVVNIHAGLDQPEFVKMVVEECYRAGASEVLVDWAYQPLTKLHVRYQSVKTLAKVDEWRVEKLKWMEKELPVQIHLISDDPDGLKGINIQKMAKGRQGTYRITKPFNDAMEGKYQWCIAAVPGVAWAKKVFPDLKKNQAMEKLWAAILECSLVREGEDAVENWDKHNADIKSRCQYLNSLGIETLEYSSSNGTNFTVGMIPQAQFCGGSETAIGSNYEFHPNIPSEECFISPMKGVADGIVYATKPLSYNGQLIENFSVSFQDGKVTEVHAEKGEDVLKQMVAMDEGASYLGECALVPFESPVNKTGLLFYETLFDENACCHLALGRGFIDTIKDYHQYSLEECQKMGVNDSMIHTDFMIGSRDLSIKAHCKDGRTIDIFKDGTWAF